MATYNSGSLKTTPTIPGNVYKQLPEPLKHLLEQFEETREKDVALISMLAILSGCFSNLKGKYDKDFVHPNLYSFIVAPAASGKGTMKYAKELGMEIQNKLEEENKKLRSEYAQKMSKWKKAKSDEDPPIKPKCPVLYLPGNSSASSIYSLLEESNGTGIICETEADTLTSSLKQEWGDFSPLLRHAFHHESYSMSRKTDSFYSSIDYPRLSILLTGTPNQVPDLIKSTEDGLCSRFCFYCFSSELAWRNVTPCDSCLDIGEVFQKTAKEISQIREILEKKQIIFKLSTAQFNDLNAHFENKTERIKAFENEDTMGPAVKRMGLITFRIAMVLTVLRNSASLGSNNSIVCDDTDFSTALNLSNVLFEHILVMYGLLPQRSAPNVSADIRRFYAELPSDFSREQADEIGDAQKLATRTVTNYLSKLIGMKFLEKESRGIYKKMVA